MLQTEERTPAAASTAEESYRLEMGNLHGNGTDATPDGKSGGPVSPKRKKQASRLVKLALEDGVELFHNADREKFATFTVGNHRETHPLRSEPFKDRLRWLYFRLENESAPGSQAMQEAIGTLEARAWFGERKLPVFTRIAEHNGAIYLDLCDDDWQVIEIDAGGWRKAKDAPIRFRRKKGMLPLPLPVPGGRVEGLRPFVNYFDDDEWRLLVAWLVAALRPRGPYPVISLTGEQGSAKSTTARVLRRLVDPNVAELRSQPKDFDDLMVAAKNGSVVALDNLSSLSQSLSDFLCRLATGAGHGKRQLYTDDEEVIFTAMRPIILTSIGDVVTKSDLIDRTLLFSLPNISDRRRDEEGFWKDFEQARPLILGALLDAVAVGLRNLPTTRLTDPPRMADFARWVTAAEPALGWEPGAFLASYKRNRADADSLALTASSLAQAVVPFTKRVGDWRGIATELLKRLLAEAGPEVVARGDFPKDSQALGNDLRRIAPNLRAAGVFVDFARRGNGRLISLRAQEGFTGDGMVTAGDGLVVPESRLGDGSDGGDGLSPVLSKHHLATAGDGSDGFSPVRSKIHSVHLSGEDENTGSEREHLEQEGIQPSLPSLPSSLHDWDELTASPCDRCGRCVSVLGAVEVLTQNGAIWCADCLPPFVPPYEECRAEGEPPRLRDHGVFLSIWLDMLEEIGETHLRTRELLDKTAPFLLEGDALIVGFLNRVNARAFIEGPHLDRLAQALFDATGTRYRIEVVTAVEPRGEPAEDPTMFEDI